jgi:hypothetical protein
VFLRCLVEETNLIRQDVNDIGSFRNSFQGNWGFQNNCSSHRKLLELSKCHHNKAFKKLESAHIEENTDTIFSLKSGKFSRIGAD